MADVFISYAREDRLRVQLLASALEREGLSVWCDPEIQPGTAFDEVIDAELAAAKVVLGVWSEQSVTSRWVREEVNDGLESGRLVPVRIDDVALPRGFKLIQTVDLTQWDGRSRSTDWLQVLNRIADLLGNPPTHQRVETDEASSLSATESLPDSALNQSGTRRPTKFTVIGSVGSGAARFFSEPMSYLVLSTICFAPFFVLATVTLKWSLEVQQASTEDGVVVFYSNNEAIYFLSIWLLNTFVSLLVGTLLQALFSVKIEAQYAGLNSLSVHLGEFASKLGKIVRLSLFIAFLFSPLYALQHAPAIIDLYLEKDLNDNAQLLMLLTLFAISICIIVLSIRYNLAANVTAIEGTGIFLSLRRSRELMRGHAWRYAGLLFVLTLISSLVFVVIIPFTGGELGDPDTWESAYGDTAGLIILGLGQSIMLIITSVMRAEAFFQIYSAQAQADRRSQ